MTEMHDVQIKQLETKKAQALVDAGLYANIELAKMDPRSKATQAELSLHKSYKWRSTKDNMPSNHSSN